MEEYEDDNIAKFNAGLYKVNRLHKIKELVNFCKLNPKSMNPDYSEFSYILWFRSLNSFLFEIISKLLILFHDTYLRVKNSQMLHAINEKLPLIEIFPNRALQ